jgi:two-component system, OmpR family, sensor kinase
MRVPAIRSLRFRLIVMFGAVVATAMGVLFLYVVPSLREDLVQDRLDRLEQVARTQQHAPGLERAMRTGTHMRRPFARTQHLANATLTGYRLTADGLQPLAAAPPTISAKTALAVAALRNGVARGRTPSGGLVVAFRVSGGVLFLSQGLSDVTAAAALVERQILVATLIAVAVAVIVGWGAALAISIRLERLKEAASRIAAGSFDQPIGDTSPDELGQVARSFDLMQARLAQVDRARKDFIANASHELRTPLFSLAGFLELLAEEDLDADTRAEFVQSTREQVSRLTKLAGDLLDLSRLDSGAVGLVREPVDLTVTARTLVREFRGLGSRHGSRIVLARPPSPPPRGIGDEDRVQQIGRALLDNAVRHTPPGTVVRVAVESEDGVVRLDVSDDGPGIDPRVRDHLFERFSRGPETTAAGSGLGLAIADELAHRMGGSIVVDSANGGTRFSLVLPAEPAG